MGSTDLLVYYWGRPPIAFLRRARRARAGLEPHGGSFVRREVAPEGGPLVHQRRDAGRPRRRRPRRPDRRQLFPRRRPDPRRPGGRPRGDAAFDVAGRQRRAQALAPLGRAARRDRADGPVREAEGVLDERRPTAGPWRSAPPTSTATSCPRSTSPTTSAPTGCCTTARGPASSGSPCWRGGRR